ncbi:hypothetical protein BV20DRAFT_983451 [Pilatotrama ljubarskyi]|nr:hypothetical protein BV20DRAFT_983451 [Pilatotrama ljubarskyi]
MAVFSDVWDIVIGVLSIVAGVPLIVRYVHKQLPSKKLQVLLDLLDDTSTLFTSCIEQGLVNESAAAEFQTQLTKLRDRGDEVRLEALSAKSYTDDVVNMVKGLTRKINAVCKDVRELRAEISTTSFRERERLEAERRAITSGTVVESSVVESSNPVSEASAADVGPHTQLDVAYPAPGAQAVDVETPASASEQQGLGRADSEGASNSHRAHRDSQMPTSALPPPVLPDDPNRIRGSSAGPRPVAWRKHRTPLSRARAVVRSMRRTGQKRPQLSLEYRGDSEAIYLVDLSPVQMVDDSDEEWEDLPGEKMEEV